MTRWTQRLPVRAALAAAVGGVVLGALGALIVQAYDAPWYVDSVLAITGAAFGAAWWAARQSRTLRGAVEAASTALAGRAIRSSTGAGASESTVVVDAVHALVERAERNTRELSQRQAYAAVGDFAAELARELAPSVATARTAMRTLEQHMHIDSPLHAPLTRAQRELHRLSNTLQDTLRLARSGQLATRRLDLWMPLRSALKTVGEEAQSRRVLVQHPPHGHGPVWIHGDADALEQLFLNLLINAAQSMNAGGRVEVQVALSHDDVSVTISDSGVGIPEGALDRVFEPFYTTKSDKAGLGLAIAWRTAAAHGGKLTIESSLGRGTDVNVSLPLADSLGEYSLEAGMPINS